MTSFEDHLSSGAGQAFKFAEIGTKIVGEILAKTMVTSTDYDGNPEEVPVITIHTADGEDWDIWLSKAALRNAISKALTATGPGTRLDIGGTIAIERLADGTPRKAGYSAPHQFRAAWKPPTSTPVPEPVPARAAVDQTANDLFGT